LSDVVLRPDVDPVLDLDLDRSRRVHLIGIGGAGMSAIARILVQRGHDVRGSDLTEGRASAALRALGVRIYVGHDAAHVADAELVVTSTAVPADNVEIRAARERDVPVVPRARMLAATMAGSTAVLIAGTHGKTTTTSMVVVALHGAGMDPTFAIGGELNESGTNAHAGHDAVAVAEADESDRSFLAYVPDVVVITNVEHDHPETFADLDDVIGAFEAFLARRRTGAPAIVCIDDPGVRRLASSVAGPIVTYGADPSADVRLVEREVGHEVVVDGRSHPLALAVPGQHNRLNALAAIAVCRALGVEVEQALVGLQRFVGAARRFQTVGEAAGVRIVDDYAHHPTELRATLAAARSLAPARVVCVVQPHRYSRTAVLGAELGRAAAGADLVIVTDVYGAGEPPVPGVTGALVAEAARAAGGRVVHEPHLSALVDVLAGLVQEGDLVLITGAGDVTQVGPMLLARLLEH
jgi:UDP-N-acetylmuramate--alanine ligase